MKYIKNLQTLNKSINYQILKLILKLLYINFKIKYM
jgi:hypothetical protein